MVLDRQVPSRIGNKTLEYQGSRVTLPSTQELLGEDAKKREYLSTQVRLAVTFFLLKMVWAIFFRIKTLEMNDMWRITQGNIKKRTQHP